MSNPSVTPPRADVRLLGRRGLRGRLVLERLDGDPVTEADLCGVRLAIASTDDLAVRADRTVSGAVARDPARLLRARRITS